MVLHVTNHTGTVDVVEIHNVVFIKRIRLARTVEEAEQATAVERHENVLSEAGNNYHEYVAECMACHKEGNKRNKYLERWYDYSSTDDT